MKEFGEAQLARELESIVALDCAIRDGVVVETQQMEMQDGRERVEHDALDGVLQPVSARLVLVVPVQRLRLYVFPEGLRQVLLSFNVELHVVVALGDVGGVVYVLALYVRGCLPLEQSRDGALHACFLHLHLELVEQYSQELLYVVLHERVERLPAEGLGQLFCADRLVHGLQVVEHPLQRQPHALGAVICLGWHLVHCLAQRVREVEHLE